MMMMITMNDGDPFSLATDDSLRNFKVSQTREHSIRFFENKDVT